MVAIHEALAKCCAGNPVFYKDVVDIHINPEIGADWQQRGQQKRAVTLGQNEKYYLAGALQSDTGKISYVGVNSKGSSIFICLLKNLKATYRQIERLRSLSIPTSSTKAVKRCAGWRQIRSSG